MTVADKALKKLLDKTHEKDCKFCNGNGFILKCGKDSYGIYKSIDEITDVEVCPHYKGTGRK